jgi:hypothetical protein
LKVEKLIKKSVLLRNPEKKIRKRKNPEKNKSGNEKIRKRKNLVEEKFGKFLFEVY